MSWELIRDFEHEGENGREKLRISPDPEGSLTARLVKVVTEFERTVNSPDPNVERLYDARDVLNELLWMADPHGDWEMRHAATVAVHGLYNRHLEYETVEEHG